ncbi:zinc finger CCHC domain-containing protein 24-like [Ostrinia nubilalis]|uniref:zinc finger CCHC domain-containing protein 24-like n=1 Tax=Ostrinia nubilalis TaxID=29057 RepID=UPI0030825930
MPGKGLTPYQGKNRCFGAFKCPQCKRSWSSAYSWADCAEDCIICNIRVYPFRQTKLKKRRGTDNEKKRHLTELCEKCEQLGYSCSSRRRQF